MDMVERVARALCCEGGFDPDEIMPNDGPRWKYYAPGAKAAIRAMLEGQEPVAWRYSSRFGTEVCKFRWARDEGRTSDDWIGWTETPLYDLSALKEVVG